jgi:hypothetical protein
MKNKLMRTTALVGSMVALGAGVSVAQTTVTGSLDISYRAVGTSTLATGTNSDAVNSFRGFGKESQINIANKGKLNNGLDYAAGFSIEFDGNDLQGSATQTSTMQGIHGEGVYLNIIDGNTTYHVGADWIQNPDSHALLNPAGVGYITSFGNGVGTAGTAKQGIYPTVTNSAYQAYGFGVVQKTSFGNFSASYVPSPQDAVAGPDIGNNQSIANYEGTAESAIELGFVGDLGVKGLTVQAFYNERSAPDQAVTGANNTGKVQGTALTAAYNFGQLTVAGDYRVTEGGAKTTSLAGTAATAAGNPDEQIKGKAMSLTYAATNNVSLGVVYGKASSNRADKPSDEKIKIAAIGYNLGPVALNAEYTDTANIGGVAGVDAKELIVKASTKF